MNKQSVRIAMIQHYNQLTSVEKRIADFFIENKTQTDFSSKHMTNMLYVSEASLSRFAKKCGYRGYREFIYKYEEDFLENSHDQIQPIHDVYNDYHLLLKQSFDMIDNKQITRCSNMILDASYVLVCGIGSSALVAREMKLRFMRLGILVEYVDQSDEMKVQSVLIKKNSLVIGLSLYAKKEEVLYALQQAKHNGAKTMLITGNIEKSFGFIDEKITVPIFKNLNYGNIISPQFPLLIIVDLFYRNLLSLDQTSKDMVESHQKTLVALDETKINKG